MVVPAYFKGTSAELTVADVKKFNIEGRLATDPKTPKYHLYYATVHGDVLGQVILTDREILFDPLNEQFKGLFSYENGDLNNNHRMGFIVDYDDIVGEVFKIAMPDSDDHSKPHDATYDLQIGIRHTGN